MNEQEQITAILAQGYQILAKAMLQEPSKEGFQLILLLLGEDGILACVLVAELGPETVAKTMAEIIQLKQTQKAERGAKLNRLMALSNKCPEGYMKKGGKCKKCEKGSNIKKFLGAFSSTGYFKNGSKIKKYGDGDEINGWDLVPGVATARAYGRYRDALNDPKYKYTMPWGEAADVVANLVGDIATVAGGLGVAAKGVNYAAKAGKINKASKVTRAATKAANSKAGRALAATAAPTLSDAAGARTGSFMIRSSINNSNKNASDYSRNHPLSNLDPRFSPSTPRLTLKRF